MKGSRNRVLVWHRRIGLAALLLVAIVAATGVLLNHAESLGLNRGRVDHEWLLAWYGMGPETAPVSYRLEDDWVTWLEGHVYLNGRPIAEEIDDPKGAVAVNGVVAVGAAREVLLFTSDGDLIERMGPVSLPGTVEAIGGNKHIILGTPEGRFRAAADLVAWEPTETEAEWSRPTLAPEPIRDRVLAAYRGRGLAPGPGPARPPQWPHPRSVRTLRDGRGGRLPPRSLGHRIHQLAARSPAAMTPLFGRRRFLAITGAAIGLAAWPARAGMKWRWHGTGDDHAAPFGRHRGQAPARRLPGRNQPPRKHIQPPAAGFGAGKAEPRRNPRHPSARDFQRDVTGSQHQPGDGGRLRR